MLDYDVCKSWTFEELVRTYTERDTMLYALGLGMGADPLDAGQLRFVYEKDLQAVPTMATVIGSPSMWLRDPRIGANYLKLVHGEQDLILFRPLPVKGTLIGRNKVLSVTDKGEGKGAVVVVVRELVDQADGSIISQGKALSFLRDDGGFSVKDGKSDPAPEPLPDLPARAPDHEVSLTSLPQSALIYRLSGDYNPLHADPAVAAKAGFERPILHGLCSYGMGGHAVLQALLGYDATRFKRLAVRFSSPVYPGETVRYALWQEDTKTFRLRARIDAREKIVLSNGIVEIA